LLDLEIRLLLLTEQDVAVQILVDCFGDKYKDAAPVDVSATFSDYFYAPKSFIALYKGQYCGFVQSVRSPIHKDIYNILWLSVLPQFRRRGIAANMMAYAEHYITDTVFHGHNGSFILVAEYHSIYYENLGYTPGLLTYDNYPIMIKHIRNN